MKMTKEEAQQIRQEIKESMFGDVFEEALREGDDITAMAIFENILLEYKSNNVTIRAGYHKKSGKYTISTSKIFTWNNYVFTIYIDDENSLHKKGGYSSGKCSMNSKRNLDDMKVGKCSIEGIMDWPTITGFVITNFSRDDIFPRNAELRVDFEKAKWTNIGLVKCKITRVQ